MNTKQDLQITSYTVAAELFDKGKTIYDCFFPLVRTVMLQGVNGQAVSLISLQQKMNEIFRVSVPKPTLKRLLDTMIKNGRIVRTKTGMFCLKTSKDYNETYETEITVEAEDFFCEFQRYLESFEISLSLEEIKEKCCHWVYMHSIDVSSLIGQGELRIKGKEKASEVLEGEWKYSVKLADFLIQLADNGSSLFESFKKIYNGAVQASLLNFQPQQIGVIDSCNVKFNKIVLDSNFLFRLLNLQTDYDAMSAAETISNLSKYGAKYYVLENTLEEMQRSIKAFLRDIDPYTVHTAWVLRNKSIRVSGFLDAFRRGVTRKDFFELTNIGNLKKKISGIITVEFVDDYSEEQAVDESEIESLIAIKKRDGRDGYGKEQACHDLSLIRFCRDLRRDKKQELKDVTCWVLTNDEKLEYWNREKSIGFQECITEIQLSNLIWLQKKRPINAGLMQTVIALANGNALTVHGATAFAQRICSYAEKHKEDKAVDTIALLLGSESLTADDIRRANDEESVFEELIKIKLEEYEVRKDKEIRERTVLQEENARLQEISERNRQMQDEHLQRVQIIEEEKKEAEIDRDNYKEEAMIQKTRADTLEISAKEEQLKYLNKELQRKEDEYNRLSRVEAYRKESERRAVRITSIVLVLLATIVFIAVYKWIWPTVRPYLDRFIALPDGYRELLELVAPIVLFALVYLLTGIIFGVTCTPSNIFSAVKKEIHGLMVHRCMDKEGIARRDEAAQLDADIVENRKEYSRLQQEFKKCQHELDEMKSKYAA